MKEKAKHVNKELEKLAIHKNLQKLNFNGVMMDFDDKSLYPNAMWDKKPVYLEIKIGFAFKLHMNLTYVEAFSDQTFNQDGNESAILKIKYNNPPDLIFQHLPVREKVKFIDVNRMKNGYIIDTLTSVDICEIVKTAGRVIETYEGVIYRENFKIPPLRKFIEKLFALGQEYKKEYNDLMQGLVKLLMNSLYGVQKHRDSDQTYKCKSKHWMETGYDDNVLNYWRLPNGNYTIVLEKKRWIRW